VNLGSEEFEELVNGKLVNRKLGSDIRQRAGQQAILFQKYVNLEVGLIDVSRVNKRHTLNYFYIPPLDLRDLLDPPLDEKVGQQAILF
jgi:hypothetical protein